MPKTKTRKSVAKRVKVTGSGKVSHAKAGRRHLLSGRNRKRKRDLRRKGVIPGKGEEKMIKETMPYCF